MYVVAAWLVVGCAVAMWRVLRERNRLGRGETVREPREPGGLAVVVAPTDQIDHATDALIDRSP